MVLRPILRPTPGIFLHHADRTGIEQVAVHYAFGMGLLAQMTEDITLNGFSVRRRGENDPRLFTTQADATHFSGCKGRIVSENGLYEGMADDAINIHGTYLRVLEQRNSRTIRVSYMHNESWGFDWGEPGDEVQFIRSRTMEYEKKKARIISIRPTDAETETGAREFEIVFDVTNTQFEVFDVFLRNGSSAKTIFSITPTAPQSCSAETATAGSKREPVTKL